MITATLNQSAPAENAPGHPETTRPRAVQHRLTFDGVLHGEWIKLLSLRSIRWSIALMIVLSWGSALLMSLAMAGSEFATAEAMPTLIVQSATLGSLITVLIMGVLGVLSITSEYTSGLILSSLTAVPKRLPLLAAKTLVVAALGLAVGVVCTYGGALLAAIFLGDGAFAALGSSAVLLSLLSTAVYLMLAALFALGAGALLRSTAGAISVVVVVFFVSIMMLQILSMTGWAWVGTVTDWIPATLGNTLAMAPVTPGYSGAVGYWGAMLGLVAWAAAPFVPATILLKTRDAV